MAGIYIHIPFCKQACHYCDFHFSTSLKNKEKLLKGIKSELILQNFFFNSLPLAEQEINSIYFGGGTPSLALSGDDIKEIIKIIELNYLLNYSAEITLEANPDDLSVNYLQNIFEAGINRLSIGIQSFNDNDLKFLNRSHTSEQAINCIKAAIDVGFNNLSIDLIYGIQTSDIDVWKNNLELVNKLPVNHLSCYSLTIENKTVFDKWVKEKKIADVDDENVVEQFNYLTHWAQTNKFDHYEISNFCKSEQYSKHNTSYWQNKAYLGVGPSAHSYNLIERFWNVKNNNVYIKSLGSETIASESELLTEENKFNEYLMTGLRTKWGISLTEIQLRFHEKYLAHIIKAIKPLIKNKMLSQNNKIITITNDGKLISDKIITSLIIS